MEKERRRLGLGLMYYFNGPVPNFEPFMVLLRLDVELPDEVSVIARGIAKLGTEDGIAETPWAWKYPRLILDLESQNRHFRLDLEIECEGGRRWTGTFEEMTGNKHAGRAVIYFDDPQNPDDRPSFPLQDFLQVEL